MVTSHGLYMIRIQGRLGATALAAFPSFAAQSAGTDADTVLIGLLRDRSAVFGVLSTIESLGLELLEFRKLTPEPRSTGGSDGWSLELS